MTHFPFPSSSRIEFSLPEFRSIPHITGSIWTPKAPLLGVTAEPSKPEIVPASPPRGVVFILHGFAEHHRRYDAVAANLCAAGFVVASFDFRGHGISGGPRGIVRTHRDLCDDADRVLRALYTATPLGAFLLPSAAADSVRTDLPLAPSGEVRVVGTHTVTLPRPAPSAATAAAPSGRGSAAVPLLLLAHSNGGLTGALWLSHRAAHHPVRVSAAFLSAPFLGLGAAKSAGAPSRALSLTANTLAGLCPAMPVPRVDPTLLSADVASVTAYEEDPLTVKGATVGFVAAATRAQASCFRWAPTLHDVPIVVAQGMADAVCWPPAALAWFQRLPAVPGNKWLPFEGGRHELFHEASPLRDAAYRALLGWADTYGTPAAR
eukprot:TRINITY_DN879_c0_g3_i2.p1 TRINITY_DN879_c0_g3~~TRINITY_DN879_c0_g3_i2.p1  ORF type:complete len:377 (+),score=41.68 TRINITY_DN879_c0_g3_i2:508-1638(+)